MSRFVRSSKYRHVYGTASKKEGSYDNLKISSNAIDGKLIAVNGQFISINWACSGGGAFAIIPLEKHGKVSSDYPLVMGHTATVLDTAFSPFNDYLVASASEDTKIMIWSIPKEGFTTSITTPQVVMSGHNRKVTSILFHPTAENLLTSASSDFLIKVWDIEKGIDKITLTSHQDSIHSLSYSYNGSLLATSSKDKKLRIFDIRSGDQIQDTIGHQGVKGSYVEWLGDSNRFVSTGFSRSSLRQISLWDSRNLSSPLKTHDLEVSSGSLMPHYDQDSKILFLAGKGDGNIRYFEIAEEDPFIHFLSEYKSSEPQRDVAFLSKRSLNISENEIARAYKVTTNAVEYVSFKVPRKSDVFQTDLFPDTVGPVAPLTANEFLNGKNSNPILISLEKGFSPPMRKEFVTNVVQQLSSLPSSHLSPPILQDKLNTRSTIFSPETSSNENSPSMPSENISFTQEKKSRSNPCHDNPTNGSSILHKPNTLNQDYEELRMMIQSVQQDNINLKKFISERDERYENLSSRVTNLISITEELLELKKKFIC